MNYFEELNQINVNDKTEQKNGLTYLSWAYAWAELKKKYPDANYKVYEREDGCNYFTDGRTCWVKVSVTVPSRVEYETLTFIDIEHIEYLPVMDFRNKSIPLENVTSMDVNKAIQRALTKAIARHGLGLYIYAGEDIPETYYTCEKCKGIIAGNSKVTPEQIVEGTKRTYGQMLCLSCANTLKKQKEAQKILTEQMDIPVEIHDEKTE